MCMYVRHRLKVTFQSLSLAWWQAFVGITLSLTGLLLICFKRKVRETIKIKIEKPAMNRNQEYKLLPFYDELRGHMTLEAVGLIKWAWCLQQLSLKLRRDSES